MSSEDAITMDTSMALSTTTTTTAPKTSSNTTIDYNGNDNIIKPYPLPKTNLSYRKPEPIVTINKLEVHVVGGSNNNTVQGARLNPSKKKITDIHGRKLDFDDLQVNTETLNKSYLWKYKVRLS
jgi:hypothetical protein